MQLWSMDTDKDIKENDRKRIENEIHTKRGWIKALY